MMLASLEEAEEALGAFVPVSRSMRENYSLDRMRTFLGRVGNPQDSMRVIHVAGTSGKTSTCYFIRAMLQSSGLRTALTISPHISSIVDRVQVDGRPLGNNDFLEALGRFLDIVAESAVDLTYFEVLVSFAYWTFAQRQVDVVIVETGLGGLLDGTNVVARPDKICVISDIGLDHTEILGDSIEEIAAQKAGIVQSGNTVFMIDQPEPVVHVIDAVVTGAGGALHRVSVSDDQAAASLPDFQARNWSLARAAADSFLNRTGRARLSQEQLQASIHHQPPGRLEVLQVQGAKVILDGAHNPQKMKALVSALEAMNAIPTVVLANFTVAPSDKLISTWEQLARTKADLLIPAFSATQDVWKPGSGVEEMRSQALAAGFTSVRILNTLDEGVTELLARKDQIRLVTGSLYLVAQVRTILGGRK